MSDVFGEVIKGVNRSEVNHMTNFDLFAKVQDFPKSTGT